jgi:hypothetical protein
VALQVLNSYIPPADSIISLVRAMLGHVMTQIVSHWPLATEACDHDQVSPCGICGGQSGTGIDSLQVRQFPHL